MPISSKPNSQLLNRDVARANAAHDAADILEVAQDIVNEGTQLLARLIMVTGASADPRTFHSSLLLLLRHVVEHADAVDELLRAGIYAPAALHVRAILEAHMQMLYMAAERAVSAPPLDPTLNDVDPLPADSATGKPIAGDKLEELRNWRGQAYLIAEYRRQLDAAQRYQTMRAQPWLERITGKAGAGPAILSDPNSQSELRLIEARLNGILSTHDTQAIDAAFTAARGKRKFDPTWYELEKGPSSVRALAASVGLLGSYDLFYAPASAIMHAANVSGQLGPVRDNGTRTAAPLRTPHLALQTVSTFITEVLQVYYLVIRHIRPGDMPQFADWAKQWGDVTRAFVAQS